MRNLSGVSFPTPGDLPGPGVEPVFLSSHALAGGFFSLNTTWEAQKTWRKLKCLLLSERSQSKKALYSVCSTKWFSRKGKTMQTGEKSLIAMGREA